MPQELDRDTTSEPLVECDITVVTWWHWRWHPSLVGDMETLRTCEATATVQSTAATRYYGDGVRVATVSGYSDGDNCN